MTRYVEQSLDGNSNINSAYDLECKLKKAISILEEIREEVASSEDAGDTMKSLYERFGIKGS